MNERDKKTLRKILICMNKIEDYMKPIRNEDEFNRNSLIKDAVVFNLLQIGELSNKKLTDDFKNKHKSIPWKQIYGLRNRIVHDYDNVHLSIVYSTLNNELTELANEIQQLLK